MFEILFCIIHSVFSRQGKRQGIHKKGNTVNELTVIGEVQSLTLLLWEAKLDFLIK